jgi:hypothetical protein
MASSITAGCEAKRVKRPFATANHCKSIAGIKPRSDPAVLELPSDPFAATMPECV